MRLVCLQCDRCVAQHQSTCTMDAKGLKCVKCIRDKQGCFWGHVSILGRIKKGYKEEVKGKAGLDDEDEDDDDDDEEEEVWAPRVPRRRSTRLPVAGKSVQCVRYFILTCVRLVGPSRPVRKVPPPTRSVSSSGAAEGSRGRADQGLLKMLDADKELEEIQIEKRRLEARILFMKKMWQDMCRREEANLKAQKE